MVVFYKFTLRLCNTITRTKILFPFISKTNDKKRIIYINSLHLCVHPSDDNSAAILWQNRPLHFLWQNRLLGKATAIVDAASNSPPLQFVVHRNDEEKVHISSSSFSCLITECFGFVFWLNNFGSTFAWSVFSTILCHFEGYLAMPGLADYLGFRFDQEFLFHRFLGNVSMCSIAS